MTLRARVSEDIAHELQSLRDELYGRLRLRLVHRNRVVDSALGNVRRTTRAGGADELTIELEQVVPVAIDPMRAGTTGMSADELIETGMRALFFDEPVPQSLGLMTSLAETGIDVGDLRQGFDQPNEIAAAITRLVVADGLVGSGRARRLSAFALGPRVGDRRRVLIEWEDPRVYSNVEPGRRRVEGDWRRP